MGLRAESMAQRAQGVRHRAEEFEIGFLKTYGIKLRSEATSLFDAYSPPLEDSTLDVRCSVSSMFMFQNGPVRHDQRVNGIRASGTVDYFKNLEL